MQISRKRSLGAFFCGLIVLVAALSGGGCRSAQPRYAYSPLPADLFPPGEHRLSPGEEFTLRFGEETNYTARIKEDGTVNLPLIGDVNAAGKTYYELNMAVYELYVPRFYRPGVTRVPVQRVYFVGGQVTSPGRQRYLGATTVTKAIQSAGDFTDFAAKHRVALIRANGQKIEVDCIKASKDQALDLPLYPGDKITVPQRTFGIRFGSNSANRLEL